MSFPQNAFQTDFYVGFTEHTNRKELRRPISHSLLEEEAAKGSENFKEFLRHFLQDHLTEPLVQEFVKPLVEREAAEAARIDTPEKFFRFLSETLYKGRNDTPPV